MSSSFYKKTAEPQTKLREFNVGDPDEMPSIPVTQPTYLQNSQGYELSPAERDELQKLRQETIANKNKVGGHAKQRIELLANIGRLFKDVEIDGIVFSLRTLKAKESREAMLSIFKCTNDADAAFEIRRQTLARAIFKIDGQDIESTLGGADFDLKLGLVDDMEETIITKLYNEFNELRHEVGVKYGIESETQAKEVAEDLKK